MSKKPLALRLICETVSRKDTKMDRPVFDVEIQNGSGECPQFTVTMHYFGPQMRGEEHNRIVMRSLKFIEDALNEKIARDAKGEVRNALPK